MFAAIFTGYIVAAIVQFTSLSIAYYIEAALCAIGVILFTMQVAPHFKKNRLR
ncbi:MAG: hypothetical protein PHG98_07970 [Bacteroidales bacterium]|nr:hypothetical protein [Bacteroidales bacterium]MDD4068354.1 hypothetical protein [Bacteroidales bacterium]MDD4739871.1 hypothetical protein [Bacteroidales bacterium]